MKISFDFIYYFKSGSLTNFLFFFPLFPQKFFHQTHRHRSRLLHHLLTVDINNVIEAFKAVTEKKLKKMYKKSLGPQSLLYFTNSGGKIAWVAVVAMIQCCIQSTCYSFIKPQVLENKKRSRREEKCKLNFHY